MIPKTTSSKPHSAPTSSVVRVVPTELQLVRLHQIYEPQRWSSNKGLLAQAVGETGLTEKWIRRWLERKRRDTKAKNAAAEHEIFNIAVSSTPQRSFAGAASLHPNADGTISQSSNQAHSTVLRGKLHPFGLDDLPKASSSQILLATPGTSFTIPLNASRTVVDPAEIPAASAPLPSVPSQTGLSLRSMVRSPSLGYIPIAFPMTFAPIGLQAGHASTAAADHFSCSVSQPLVPTIPALPPSPVQIPVTDSHSSNMAYLSQLLFEASDPMPLADVCPSELSGYLTALGQHPTYSLSFNPSLYSHSTSVRVDESANLAYAPPPVSYKTRFADLAALTKRIRATFAENVRQSELIECVESPVQGQERLCDTGKRHITPAGLVLIYDLPIAGSSAVMDVKHPNWIIDGAGPQVKDVPSNKDAIMLSDEDTDDEDELLTPSGDVSAFFDSMLQNSVDSSAGCGKTHEPTGLVTVMEQ